MQTFRYFTSENCERVLKKRKHVYIPQRKISENVICPEAQDGQDN